MEISEHLPFGLVVSWGPPHTPFIAPPEFEAMYDAGKIALRPNVQMNENWLRLGDNGAYKGSYTAPEMILKDFTAKYYAMVSNLDHNWGRLLRALDDLDLAKETIVVSTSDHGEMLGSHGQLHKWQPWEESLRVPFIIRYPKAVKPALRPNVLFGTPDILPTLFGLMGLPVPSGVEGTDLSGIFVGKRVKDPTSSFLLCACAATTWGGRWTDLAISGRGFPAGFMRPYRGIRTQIHTYVRDRSGPWFLYNNEKDPYQLDNLLETKGKSAIPPELDRELDDWLERTCDFFGSNQDYQKSVDLRTGLVLTPESLKRSA
jgi:arylsulfatase A-like enzyme